MYRTQDQPLKNFIVTFKGDFPAQTVAARDELEAGHLVKLPTTGRSFTIKVKEVR